MNDKKNIRMCVCCRERKDKYTMIRVASKNGIAVIDENLGVGGRGAYVCSAQCLENSLKGRRLDRAVKCPVGDDIYEKIRARFELIEKRES
jgi:predicted RNA-binding protein YlxR (DUF448 family)